ncbi:hypothetical protein [Streptomyces spectabilis]|uniref:Uncharacterized protein n=1 Tax=Streptomyces spectabilis TaxID=68270 RepID=A0A5P2X0V2_STRST|nr:hypothetical protein [Streptomyces spectabilis]MBB5108031.1 hypothetical protein [Streptomyces spectabilis]MCI3907843.1 hypothetical protein [Streptomyces spectabilis]MCI3907872.1 hypothetical protein [Streptomyces spectabilis]QEV57334.1 hypothetical protein CP982_00070 [Streptomyces spectabilis]GGV53143.1 hypothetical protein GCM10010245_83730 [Streptomyces spectabilis]
MNKICSLARVASVLGGAITLIATLTGPAAAAAGPDSGPAAANLHTLTCYENQDLTGGDQIYLQVNGQTVWSSADSISCDHDSPVAVPVNRLAKTGDTVSLYDEDFPDADDHLGSDTVEGSRGTLTFNLDDALYTLVYGPA